MVNVLSALLTPMIAFLGCYIAWQQWRVNERSLKHALFKKRYRQFEATRDFVASIMTRGKVIAEEHPDSLLPVPGRPSRPRPR